mgnify:CR=1 FL=1
MVGQPITDPNSGSSLDVSLERTLRLTIPALNCKIDLILLFSILFRCSDNNCYQINVTDWFGPIHMVQPIYGIILPLLSFTTLIFNSMIILVLTR